MPVPVGAGSWEPDYKQFVKRPTSRFRGCRGLQLVVKEFVRRDGRTCHGTVGGETHQGESSRRGSGERPVSRNAIIDWNILQMVKDVSDTCPGAKFNVVVVAKAFEGIPLLERHRKGIERRRETLISQ